MNDHLIVGTPPRPVADWIQQYAEDCEAYARRTINPFAKLRLRAMARAYYEASDTVRAALKGYEGDYS